MRLLVCLMVLVGCASSDDGWVCADSAECRTNYVGGYQQAFSDCDAGRPFDDTRGPDGEAGWTDGYFDGWTDAGCD